VSAIWSAMIGHRELLARLEREVAGERCAQGYLFAGPDGVGKVTAAMGLAQRLNCRAAQPPCGQCEGCRAVALRNPGYVQLLDPEMQAGSGAYRVRIHKIDALRRMQADVGLRAIGDQVRVWIVRTAEAMTEPAANSLLKTLEEPPAGVVIVLTAEQPAGLLDTIRSRLRRLEFGPVATADIAEWLVREHDQSPDRAAVLAPLAAGRPGKALALATDPGTEALRSEVLAAASELVSLPSAAALKVAEQLLGAGGSDETAAAERVPLALDLLEWWYRDALVYGTGGAAAGLVNQDRETELVRFAARRTATELRDGLAALHQTRLCLQRNANPALALEVLCFRLAMGGPPRRAGADIA